ncbi:sce7726 family protein [Dyella koreensis]|uniref:Sce7726 family protein n=1 Tax=Dyella koreensis TaxID=311235 RepID=A0ABW8KAU3_9GAMM
MRELEIKKALTGHLVKKVRASGHSFLEEVRLHGGEVRADLVLIEEMHCFEIKSEADSLARLISQGSRYARVFDHVTLVMAERHVAKAMELLPPWWGAMVLDPATGTFRQLRPARLNVRQSADSLASVLTKDEALAVLEDSGQMKGWRSKSLYLIQRHIANTMPLEDIKRHLRDALLHRAQRAPTLQ